MTVSSTARRTGPFAGNGVTTSVPFTFKVFEAADLEVTHTDAAGVETVLTLGGHYTVAINADQDTSPGGTLTYPVSGDPLPVGETITIVGATDYEQDLDVSSAGRFLPTAFENALDKTVILIQQLKEKLGRALLFSVNDTDTGVTIPQAADRVGLYLAFDANGDPTASAGTGADAGLRTDLAASGGSALAGFLQAGTGAVARTAQAKLREVAVAANDYSGNDTVKLLAAFTHAIPLGKVVELEGDYTVTGPITYTGGAIATGSLHIHCKGDVTITVDAASAAFRDLVYCQSTAANDASITGGSLTLNLSSKCSSGITVRHDAVGQSGTVNFSAPVTVLNAKNNDAAATYENQGILVFGDYAKVVMESPKVVGVERTNAAAGACKGISVSGFTGSVELNRPHAENILCTGGSDADGIAVFAKAGATSYSERTGTAVINDPVFIDCQGRSFKSQCSHVTVYRPRVKRQMVVAISSGVEFDFQVGNGLVIEPDYEYKLNGATSPIPASFSCVSWQQRIPDAVMRAASLGGTLRTEVVIPRYALISHQATALESHTEVDGLRVIPIGTLATTAISRAILETSAAEVEAKTARTILIVRNVAGPVGCAAIGYTGYGGTALTSKLSFEVADVRNTLGPASASRPFAALSGSTVLAVEGFLLRNNEGYRDLIAGAWAFNFNALKVGCAFTVDIAAVAATNPPGWGASGYAHIECIGSYFGATDRSVRVTVNNAAVANTVFFTQDGGTTWGTIR